MTRPPASRRESGMTLIEVLVSTVIVSLALVSGSWALSQASSSKAIHTEEPATAALIAREIHELALTLPTAPSGKPVATTGAGVVALDTLAGAKFSPPIRATLETIPDTTGWKQTVSIAVYDLGTLTKPAVAGYAAIAAGSSQIYQLTVQVTLRGADQGTWWWWLDP